MASPHFYSRIIWHEFESGKSIKTAVYTNMFHAISYYYRGQAKECHSQNKHN